MWEQIQANRRRSAILITVMAMILVFIGYGVGELIVGAGGGMFGVVLALAIWSILMVVYMTSAESILLQNTLARELKPEDSPRLFNVVEEMKLAAGLEYMPRLYLIDASMPNAFAVGRKPETSAIAVTTGLMYRLNRDELQGVIAHEIAHLKNRDAQFITLAAVMLGTAVILSEIARRSIWFGTRGRDRDRNQSRGGGQAQVVIVLVAFVFAILGPLMVQLFYFACSRKREFLADACAAQYTRYPEGLASALEKISGSPVGLEFASQATAPLFIVNPLYASGGEPDSVFSSHPSTAERIRILRGMTGASLADYEAAYDHTKGNTLIQERTLQSALQQTIRAPTNDGPIETRQASRKIVQRSYGYLSVTCDCGLEMSIPERYPSNEIRCIRCGEVLTLPSVQERDRAEAIADAAFSQRTASTDTTQGPLNYMRAGHSWESFRCACGRTIQLSPSFAAPHVRCTACGRTITVT